MWRFAKLTGLLAAILFLSAACGGGGSGASGPIVDTGPPSPPPTPPAPMTTAISLTSDVGDYIGNGSSFSYDQSDAVITLKIILDRIVLDIEGDEFWHADFMVSAAASFFEVGTYENMTLWDPNDSRADLTMGWSGEGRACSSIVGRLVVNAVEYDERTLKAIDFDFEQYCDGSVAALRGSVSWSADDNTVPPGPVDPVPDGLWEPPSGNVPETGNFVYLESQPGDHIGDGMTYLYTGSTAVFSASSITNHLSLTVESTERWWADFKMMNVLARLEQGYYPDLQRYPVHNPAKGGLNWEGEGRECDHITGWFVIDSITYDLNRVDTIELRFEQRCEGGGAALFGAIRWDANDPSRPTGPIYPPPIGLWEPDPAVTPDTGSYAYIMSETGDYIGQGRTHLYTQGDALFTVYANDAELDFQVDGDENWTSTFAGMNTLSRLEAGYYGGLERFPFHDPTIGGLTWTGEGRGCNRVEGWMVVDSVTYDGPVLTSIELRFKQSCDYGATALYGEIHWDVTDPTQPPGPINPPPVGIWEPTPGTLPAAGTFIYLESEPGDFVGRGRSYRYNQSDSILTFRELHSDLDIVVDGYEDWHANFDVMSSIDRLEPGFYGNLQRYPFHNPAKGGLTWSGEGRGCNRLDGWFAVDEVVYDGDTLQLVELRFEQHCEFDAPALRGALRWDANDSTSPPGPIVPAPADLWAPAPGITPETGNYAYFESEPGDYVGRGDHYLYTHDNSIYQVYSWGSGVRFDVDGEGDANWYANINPMDQLTRIEVGYYPDVNEYPAHNPARGGLRMSAFYSGCEYDLRGWFAVDYVTYEGTEITGIDLRFMQHCSDATGALYGEIHWRQ